MNLPVVDEVYAAVGTLASQLRPVGIETIPVAQSIGRVLADSLLADRPSPPLDFSAMDGYALRLSDASLKTLPVAGTACAGSPPVQLPENSAIQIFTGAPVPIGSECVVKREDTVESTDSMELALPVDALKLGQNIRRQGENVEQGAEVLAAGTEITPAAIAAVATFATAELAIHRRVRVSILNTGDEILSAGQSVEPWQIRDSNGPTLAAWLQQYPWIEIVHRSHVGDQLSTVEDAIRSSLAASDAILLTGGVSMGDTDYVPQAIENLGGETVFHRLPIRPGRPVLGAHLDGKLLLGLPGNPVSVAVTSRVIGSPLLKTLAGIHSTAETPACVTISDADDRTLHLVWYRLVDLNSDGSVSFSKSMGSGDLVSLARSHGFVQVPPNHSGPGPWPLHRWR